MSRYWRVGQRSGLRFDQLFGHCNFLNRRSKQALEFLGFPITGCPFTALFPVSAHGTDSGLSFKECFGLVV